MLKIDGKQCIELNVRDLVYYYMYKQYDIHFLDYDIKLLAFEDMTHDLMEDGCKLVLEVDEHDR